MLTEIFKNYIDNIDAIKLRIEGILIGIEKVINDDLNKHKDSFIVDMYLTQLMEGNINKKIEDYALNFIEVKHIDKEEKITSYIVKNPRKNRLSFDNISQSRNLLKRYSYLIDHMFDSELMSIIIGFENVISKLFYVLIKKFPECYINSQTITYSELVKNKSIEEIKEKIVVDQVDFYMRSNIFYWFKTLNDKHKFNIEDECDFYNYFIEGYYRRNIIVHNEGIVNKDYLKMIKSDYKEGEELTCSKEYLNNVMDSSIYVVLKILCESLKIFPSEKDDLIGDIIDYGVELINSENYLLSRYIFKMLRNIPNLSQELKIYIIMNYWQTFKWNCDISEEIRKEIDEFDVSACNDYIKMGVYALRDNYTDIFSILRKKISTEEEYEYISAIEIWPIFREVRKQEEYTNIKEQNPNIFSQEGDINEEDFVDEIMKEKNGKFKFKINLNNFLDKKDE